VNWSSVLALLLLVGGCSTFNPYVIPPYPEKVVLEQTRGFVEAETFLPDDALQIMCGRSPEQIARGDKVIACNIAIPSTPSPIACQGDYSRGKSFIYYREGVHGIELRWIRHHEFAHAYEIHVLGISACESRNHVSWGNRPTPF